MNKENSGIIYTALVCLGLILLILWMFFSATLGREVPEVQKEISVILYSAGTGGWESFEEGIKQAEADFSVNINVVTLRAAANAEEQLDAMRREIENGTEGIIVAVADCEKLYELIIQEPTFNVPMITVESGFDEELIPLISADNYEMGKMLGEEILKDFAGKEDLVVALADNSLLRDSVRDRKQGLLDALDGKAKIIPLRVAAIGEKADAAVALHKESLLKLSERTERPLENTKRYGIGNTASVVAALDQGRIEKLIFQNEFNMGYLAVKYLLAEIAGISDGNGEEIDFYCVSSEELYSTQYEQLLFPIVE